MGAALCFLSGFMGPAAPSAVAPGLDGLLKPPGTTRQSSPRDGFLKCWGPSPGPGGGLWTAWAPRTEALPEREAHLASGVSHGGRGEGQRGHCSEAPLRGRGRESLLGLGEGAQDRPRDHGSPSCLSSLFCVPAERSRAVIAVLCTPGSPAVLAPGPVSWKSVPLSVGRRDGNNGKATGEALPIHTHL